MKILPKETEFVYSLKKAFKTLYIEEQYQCLNYRIDLFIPSLNLAIEFDENNHKSNQLKDLKRQIKIENVLKCSFMRINEKDDIFEVSNLIVEKIMNVKNNLTIVT